MVLVGGLLVVSGTASRADIFRAAPSREKECDWNAKRQQFARPACQHRQVQTSVLNLNFEAGAHFQLANQLSYGAVFAALN